MLAAAPLAYTEHNAGAHVTGARPAIAEAPWHRLGGWVMAMIWRQMQPLVGAEMLAWFAAAKSRGMQADCPHLVLPRLRAMIA